MTVTDATGARATGTVSLAAADPTRLRDRRDPPGGAARSRVERADPERSGTADETRFSGCRGVSLLSVHVKDVALPDGVVLWVTLDFKAVGTITLRGDSGTMPAYNMGRLGVCNDDVRASSALSDVAGPQQILIGGASADGRR